MLDILIIHLIGLSSPGPDFFYIVRKSASAKLRHALAAALGISLGITFWAVFAIFGLSLLQRWGTAWQQWITFFGGLYLAWLGIKMLRKHKTDDLKEKTAAPTDIGSIQELLRGIFINLANPKVVVFFGSILASHLGSLSSRRDTAIIIAMIFGSCLIYFLLIALLFSRSGVRRIYGRFSRYIDNTAGVIFILFGIELVYSAIKPFLG